VDLKPPLSRTAESVAIIAAFGNAIALTINLLLLLSIWRGAALGNSDDWALAFTRLLAWGVAVGNLIILVPLDLLFIVRGRQFGMAARVSIALVCLAAVVLGFTAAMYP
jgi:hypothetical protein